MTARRALFAVLALCALPAVALAQAPPLALPEASQAATVVQRIGLTDITVKYHRPAVRQRTVWGDLVPYDQVWRAGANENTVVSVLDALLGRRPDAARRRLRLAHDSHQGRVDGDPQPRVDGLGQLLLRPGQRRRAVRDSPRGR